MQTQRALLAGAPFFRSAIQAGSRARRRVLRNRFLVIPSTAARRFRKTLRRERSGRLYVIAMEAKTGAPTGGELVDCRRSAIDPFDLASLFGSPSLLPRPCRWRQRCYAHNVAVTDSECSLGRLPRKIRQLATICAFPCLPDCAPAASPDAFRSRPRIASTFGSDELFSELAAFRRAVARSGAPSGAH